MDQLAAVIAVRSLPFHYGCFEADSSLSALGIFHLHGLGIAPRLAILGTASAVHHRLETVEEVSVRHLDCGSSFVVCITSIERLYGNLPLALIAMLCYMAAPQWRNTTTCIT